MNETDEKETTAQTLRRIEPMFGHGTWNLGHTKVVQTLIKDIYTKFGDNGGFFVDFLCGLISPGAYQMRCDIQGIDDYNVELLNLAIIYYDRYVTECERELKYGESMDDKAEIQLLKSRVIQLKYEVSQLNLKSVDNL